MGNLTKNFSRKEFACKCGCGEDRISLDLVERLQVIRSTLGKSLTINSGVRCSKYNIAQGGVESSEHVPNRKRPCEGVDVKCDNSLLRYGLLKVGLLLFKRVGIGDGFIHFGNRPSKTQEVVWEYYD